MKETGFKVAGYMYGWALSNTVVREILKTGLPTSGMQHEQFGKMRESWDKSLKAIQDKRNG